MDIKQLVDYLDQPRQVAEWLTSLGVQDPHGSQSSLFRMANAGLTTDLLASLCQGLAEHLPRTSDPDMALHNLVHYVLGSRSPLALGSLIERDPDTLPILLQIMSTSQYLADELIRDPESFDLLRLTEGQPVPLAALCDDLCTEIETAGFHEKTVMELLRRFKRRETMRIAYGDVIRDQRLEIVTQQNSYLAEAICRAALQAAWRTVESKRGLPRRGDGTPARFAVLALGKLGGFELDYSNKIDLLFIGDADGQTDGERRISSLEFCDRVANTFVRLLNEATVLGEAYHVNVRMQPEGEQGSLVHSVENTLQYFDALGRTWDRQTLIKARPIAGHFDLASELLQQLEPWIYRRYLSPTDIGELKALKRCIVRRPTEHDLSPIDVKTGHGGIYDIEFVIQFLQLLNGAALPAIRSTNTQHAIANLEQAGCLTVEERMILEQNYEFLRKLEHRSQIMFDLHSHQLSRSDPRTRQLAFRMGYDIRDPKNLDLFLEDLGAKTKQNQQTLDHLLREVFEENTPATPETDLILAPDSAEEQIESVLNKYGFQDIHGAYQNLLALATERIRFLSTPRCRLFLSSIAPSLLSAIGATPDPDATLMKLCRVSDSIGGKGVLWELFSFHPPSLELYVRICASSSYLSEILTKNPGMIDELMDSLLLDRLPSFESLSATLAELCRSAKDTRPILQSFKNAQHLRVGARDILRKDGIRSTHGALAAIAEVCLVQIAREQYDELVERFGEPIIEGGPADGKTSELVMVALGKLGGSEPNFHSDLDVLFLYEGEGQTRHRRRGQQNKTTSNQHFFSELAQRVLKVVSTLGPDGRLYEIDSHLRPFGEGGPLAVSLEEFARYVTDPSKPLRERQALCKARAITGSKLVRSNVMFEIHQATLKYPWESTAANEIRQMRHELQETASEQNLKRGLGGTVDIEFSVQMLQMRHAVESPGVLVPGTLEAIDALHACGHLTADDHHFLNESYIFLRSVEAGLRLMNTSARHDLPNDRQELEMLAFLLGYTEPNLLLERCRNFTSGNRARFDRMFDLAATTH
ncbi:MAG: bifunctional [glutamate--ammonia ligase]-adenylyl-L-tyrosine phosphorylase/[glutamate--ammonia-ligase] adenylyltransferase [Pirellulaceae bacterium]|nr:bifunctional [glutamate--ammonia ligase]-adenylyl-L-tyrosine phosphorylase/[glutamate--ammonia-ligase] adenylyltransferase [Pirellulaceae bacterium]